MAEEDLIWLRFEQYGWFFSPERSLLEWADAKARYESGEVLFYSAPWQVSPPHRLYPADPLASVEKRLRNDPGSWAFMVRKGVRP